MPIDRSDGNPTLDRVKEVARLMGTSTCGTDPELEVSTCFDAVSKLWERAEMPWYTDHGVGHSLRIIDHFCELSPLYQWTPYEHVVFAIAALLHDIGMQYNAWALEATETAGLKLFDTLNTPPPPLAEKDVRDGHVELGRALVMQEVTSSHRWGFPPAFCQGSSLSKRILFHACLVAFAHREGELWNKVRDPNAPNYVDHRLPGGMLFRPRLLAGTFRICDELDGTYARVPNPDRLWSGAVPDPSRVHWLSCLYVASITPRFVDGNLSFTLVWQVPLGASQTLRAQIMMLLREMREWRLRSTLDEVNDAYKHAEEGRFCLNPVVRGLDGEPQDFPQPLTPDMEDFVAAAVSWVRQEGPAAGATKAAEPERPPESTEAREGRISRPPLPTAFPSSETLPELAVEQLLEEWYSRNRLSTHVELTSGWHSDVLLHCRSLVSDQRLVRKLAKHIAGLCTERVSTVVAVGTSAIALGVNVAYQLHAAFTFTFYSPSATKVEGYSAQSHGKSHAQPHCLPEVRITLDPSRQGRIVVLDDVISTGNTSAEVIETICSLGISPDRMIHVALFRLGEVAISPIKGVSYHQLCQVPSVYYADGRENCALCARGIRLHNEWDVL